VVRLYCDDLAHFHLSTDEVKRYNNVIQQLDRISPHLSSTESRRLLALGGPQNIARQLDLVLPASENTNQADQHILLSSKSRHELVLKHLEEKFGRCEMSDFYRVNNALFAGIYTSLSYSNLS